LFTAFWLYFRYYYKQPEPPEDANIIIADSDKNGFTQTVEFDHITPESKTREASEAEFEIKQADIDDQLIGNHMIPGRSYKMDLTSNKYQKIVRFIGF